MKLSQLRSTTARNEFKRFDNRGPGGALIEDGPSFHPNKRRQAKAPGATVTHRQGPNVRMRQGTDRGGYYWTRLRDGLIVGGFGATGAPATKPGK